MLYDPQSSPFDLAQGIFTCTKGSGFVFYYQWLHDDGELDLSQVARRHFLVSSDYHGSTGRGRTWWEQLCQAWCRPRPWQVTKTEQRPSWTHMDLCLRKDSLTSTSMCVAVNLQLRWISAVCWKSLNSHCVCSLNTFQVLSTHKSATHQHPLPPNTHAHTRTHPVISVQMFQSTQSSTCERQLHKNALSKVRENNILSLVSTEWQMHSPWWP